MGIKHKFHDANIANKGKIIRKIDSLFTPHASLFKYGNNKPGDNDELAIGSTLPRGHVTYTARCTRMYPSRQLLPSIYMK